jgi:hypothetical protein
VSCRVIAIAMKLVFSNTAQCGGRAGCDRMSAILLLLGTVVVVAGVATLGFSISIADSTAGTSLIIASVTALTGGLFLIGLSAVLARLRRVAELLRERPALRFVARATEIPEAIPPMMRSTAPAMVSAPTAAPALAAPQGLHRPASPQVSPRPRPEALPGRIGAERNRARNARAQPVDGGSRNLIR